MMKCHVRVAGVVRRSSYQIGVLMRFKTLLLGAAALALANTAEARPISVTLTNTSPTGGVGLSPLWVGFHDGTFDTYNVGAAANAGVKQTAEDGNNTAITGLFSGAVQGTLAGGPAFAGAVRTGVFDVNTTSTGRYFSYLSMVVVSNDFFVGNANPTAIDLAALQPGQTISFLIGVPNISGGQNIVYDAGTEVNDFLFSLANGAFGIPGGQTGGGQGNAQGGVITAVTGNPFAGFLNTPAGGVSGNLNFNNSALYTSVGRIDITAVPEPLSGMLLATGVGLTALARKRRRTA